MHWHFKFSPYDTEQPCCSRPENMADEEEFDVSGSSDCSDDYSDSHGEIDESVMLEMTKLEDTLKVMGLKFRMIDRIGEGVSMLKFFIMSFW